MKSVATPKILAAFLVLLMLGPIVPMGAATHTDVVPDVPALPHARPSDQCLPMGLDENLLARANQLASGDPSFFLTDKSVPAVCVNGGPLQEYQMLIREADRQLDILRNVSREIQRQVDQRVEATLPESGYPDDLVKPTTVLLSDKFDGRRVGGFGDWTVVTEKGEPGVFKQQSRSTFNGTEHSWRFGDESGYERGVHQWLVSPEIDMTALNGNRTAVNDLALAREAARTQLWQACNRLSFNGQAPYILAPFCGEGTPGAAIVDAYAAAYDAAIKDLPVMQQGAYLEISYRMNLAFAQDGVRVWLYTGSQAPDRLTLFNRTFGVNASFSDCPDESAYRRLPPEVQATTNPTGFIPAAGDQFTCTPLHYGAEVLTELPGTSDTAAFRERAALPFQTDALTGDYPDTITARVNLTEYMLDRVWLLFEVKTTSSTYTSSFFDDKAEFPRQRDYGFELSRVHAEGDAYLRNFRLKDVGAQFPLSPPTNTFGDDSLTVRTATPTGAKPVTVRLHNAGDYSENGTLSVVWEEKFGAGEFTIFNTSSVPVLNVRPDEVRPVTFLWPKAPVEDRLYRVRATLQVDERVSPSTGEQTRGVPEDPRPQAADPNVTAVRPANAASIMGLNAGNLTGNLTLRIDTFRLLVPAHVGDTIGTAFEVCKSPIVNDVCEPANAAKKGEPRVLLLGVRNDGNAPENAVISMKVELDGVDKTSMLVDGPTRDLANVLPGEVRPVTWTLNPADPGAYRVRVALQHPDGSTSGTLIERNVYVQRSTGTLCFDDMFDSRECGPAFQGRLVADLGGENITASTVLGDGTLVVATDLREDRGLLAARSPAGEWSVLANISSAKLNETLTPTYPNTAFGALSALVLAPNGTLYGVGNNSTVLARATDGAVTSVTTNVTANLTNFTAAAWYGGTLWAVGTGGAVFRLVEGAMEEVNLTYVHNATLHTKPYERTLHSMLAAPNGRLYVAGELGYLASYNGQAWSEVRQEGATIRPASWLADNRTLHSLTWSDGRLWAAGNRTLMVSTTQTGAIMRNVTQPQPLRSALNYTDVFATHLGKLYILTKGGDFITCSACLDRADPGWSYASVLVPTVFENGTSRPAAIVAAAGNAERTFLVGQAGAVLELLVPDTAVGTGDWSTIPPLSARDGGVIQVARNQTGHAQAAIAFRGVPTGDEADHVRNAQKFRITANHFVAKARPDQQVYLRIFFQQFPSSSTQTDSRSLCSRDDGTIGTGTVCHLPPIMRDVAAFREPTRSDTWTRYVSEEILPPATGTLFGGLELYAEVGTLWAIDDVVLEAWVGNQWRPIVSWHGPGQYRGAWAQYNPGSANQITGSLWTTSGWEIAPEPWEIETVSAWHVSTTLADRPVWVANDEVWAHQPGGQLARLRSNWDTRLITPSIDLSDAYDPVVSFRHAYAFRTQIAVVQGAQPIVTIGDGGYVEVQYLRRGSDCGAASEEVTCGWSPFYRVRPVGGYPNITQAGFENYRARIDGSTTTAGNLGNGRSVGLDTQNPNRTGWSYWGRMFPPGSDGVIAGPRFTEDYQEVRINLNDQACTPSLPAGTECLTGIDFRGRVVRVAFHLETAGNHGKKPDATMSEDTVFNHTSEAQDLARTSFPGEGWYITDFKVLGARDLGIDLRATNMSVRVGYDVDRIGVGPGERVPVNVTVENRGIFDALGYTGELEIRRVTNAVEGISHVVDRVVLAQQPTLAAKASANHTLFWTVPAYEMGNYTLSFTATPLGIDRDEDPTDNVARLGSFARPLTAQTVRQFHTELAVSPENATIDITRYVPIFLVNTGNVPLSDFTVRRDVTILQGPLTRVIEQRAWTTDRPVPAGTRTALSVVSDDVSPTADLFWKAPERANYLFAVSGSVTLPDGSKLVSSTDRRVSAFATYFFDDVEGGPRGETTKGEWVFGPGWNVSDPGFRSITAYTFGDSDLARYPADADSSAVTPLIDIAGARSARLAFYHRYAFEQGFDAGLVEASVDGGRTWTPLKPSEDKLNKLPLGYIAGVPLSPASPLHTTGNPDDVQHAFTGDSSALPSNVDGWVLSEFDLTRYASVTEQDVPYERYGSEEMGRYEGVGEWAPQKGPNVYYNKNWLVGSEDDYRYWEVQNLTNGTIRSVAGNDSFWWSGSIALGDDETRPEKNQVLAIDVDLSKVQPDQAVVADWWEWADHFNQGGVRIEGGVKPSYPPRSQLLDAYVWTSTASGPHTVRFNLSDPKIVEQNGKWLHLRADLTSYLKESAILTESGERILKVKFGYTPYKSTTPAADLKDMVPIQYHEDRGFAIDGFNVYAERRANGQLLDSEPILTEAQAWEKAQVFDCGNPHAQWASGNTAHLGCFNQNATGVRMMNALLPLEKGVLNKTWALQNELRPVNSSWALVPVRDRNNYTADKPLPTGAKPVAWYTGDTDPENCVKNALVVVPCALPGSESRLVTPAIDLGRVAGDTADLTFWHRYAFKNYHLANLFDPIGSGGVVEIQAYDGQTGEWGAWKQLYSDPENMGVGPRNAASVPNPLDGPFRGGYSSYTVNASPTAEGPLRRNDAPFEPVFEPTLGRDVQYMYSGASIDIDADERKDGWIQERYDLTDYIGKKVRFGFHAYFSGDHRDDQKTSFLLNPDGKAADAPDVRKGGWWVSEVAVVGKVLAGGPLQLRMRAATDGNVQDGIWAVDDAALFGGRYGRNLAIFLDETPDKYGAVAGETVTIPVTIRNLGDSVRRDLAFEVRNAEKAVNLNLSGVAPKGATYAEGIFRLQGFNLAPGQSVTVDLVVRAPAESGLGQTKLLFELKEGNPTNPSDPYQPILDNEVQGFLRRTVNFTVRPAGEIEFPILRTLPALPQVGAPVELVATARNPGYKSVGIEIACKAETLEGFRAVNHGSIQTESPHAVSTVPCELVAGNTTVGPRGWENLTFRATPAVAGSLRFTLSGRLVDGISNAAFDPAEFTTVVGQSAVRLATGFDKKTDMQENWSRIPRETNVGPSWSYLRGNRAPGAILLGLNETLAGKGFDYSMACGADNLPNGGGTCGAISPPVDLHNYTMASELFLTFAHLDRFAKYDGGQVKAEVLLNELNPRLDTSWSRPCLLRPVGGYEGQIAQFLPATQGDTRAPDPNPGFQANAAMYPNESDTGALVYSGKDYFVSDNGFEETWKTAVVPLSQSCNPGDDEEGENLTLIGRTVRFVFMAYLGSPKGEVGRGPGEGWFIDDVSVGPYALELAPLGRQRANLLDNTTKAFNVVLKNNGSYPDLVRLRFDAGNSSAPAQSIETPAAPIALAPGETRIVRINVTLPRDPSLLPTEYKVRILAESILDPNAAAPVLLDLFFLPRQWAELSVTIDLPRDGVQEGTEKFLPIIVENSGLVDSVPTRVRIVDTWATGRQEYSLDLPPMPSYFQSQEDASRTLEFLWRPVKGSIGPHTLSVTVDPEILGEEYTRDNNVVSVVVPVTELLLPDVAIDNATALVLRNAVGGVVPVARDGDVSRYEVTAGEVVSLELRVVNRGRAAATNVDVRAFIGELSLPPKNVPFIAPGGEVVLTFNWLAQKGEHDLGFLLLTEGLQLSTDNDRNPGVGIAKLTVKGYEVSVEIPAIPGILEPASDVKVPFKVINTGNAGEELRLKASAPNGLSVLLPRETFYLRAGETYEGTATLHLPAQAVAGEQFISIEAVSRENPMKVAAARAPANVRAFYGGSVVPMLVDDAPPQLTIPVVLRNEGNSLEPWNVTVRLPAGWVARETLPAKVVVPANGQATLELHVTVPETTAPGERFVTVRATMPNGERRDGTISVNVLPLRAASVTVSPEAPKPAQGALAYPVVVENTGNVQAPFEMVLVNVPSGVEVKLEKTKFELPPGGKVLTTMLVRPNASIEAGSYAVTGYTLFPGVNPDTAEGRANMQPLSVSIVLHDLRLGGLEYAPRADVGVGDRVTVKVPVFNRGQTTLTNVPAHLYVDDVFIAETMVPSVAPGQKVDVTLNWTAILGTHTLTVVLDPYKDTVDGNREDNAVSALATVGVDSPTGGIAAGRANVPGFGFSLVLAAIALALIAGVWSRRQRR